MEHSQPPTTDLLPATVTKAQQRSIIRTAAMVIADTASNGSGISEQNPLATATAEKSIAGIFVTLRNDGQLRGCVGLMGHDLALGDALCQSARNAAIKDRRFSPVRSAELHDLSIEVTILGPLITVRGSPADRHHAFEIGRHGLRIQAGEKSGLLLPSVATDQGWDARQFLDGVCRKAGLLVDAWRQPQTRLEIFEGLAFSAPFPSDLADRPISDNDECVGSVSPPQNRPSLKRLARWIGCNVRDPLATDRHRQPAVAGRFYPADDESRDTMVREMIAKARDRFPPPGDGLQSDGLQSDGLQSDKPRASQRPTECLAIMTPHAGLSFSGTVAAAVWSGVVIPHDVLIVSPNHTGQGAPWAVAPHREWALSQNAVVPANWSFANAIAHGVAGMQVDAVAHRGEHGIEVQLPLLRVLAPESRVTAIAMRGGRWEQIERAAEQLALVIESMDEPPLLVISSDMNHFAAEDENRRRDWMALAGLAQGDGRHLLEVCRRHQISMCGVIPAALILETLRCLSKEVEVSTVAYDTSAAANGDRSRVVGYAGVIFQERIDAG
jgi:AmmeMemoRadiSam system protein B/AmmeMemoRadiSam system protein A